MRFESWLSLQQHTIARLRVQPGRYLARYDATARAYSAALQVTTTARGPVVEVTHGATVRARVILGAAEYDCEPRWQTGKGLAVLVVSPVGGSATAEIAGYARAALLAAAFEEYERLCGIAHEVEERRGGAWSALLIGITSGSLERRHGGLVAEVMSERDDAADFTTARRDCGCVGCRRRFRRGDAGPVREVGTLVACADCLRLGRLVAHAAPTAADLWRAAGAARAEPLDQAAE